MIPVSGFAPGVDPTTPGVVVDCTNMLPTIRGLKAAPVGEDLGLGALAADCLGAAMVRKIDDSSRVFAGTTSNLYEFSSGWTSRGSGYTGTATSKWRFAQFGDASIATNYSDAVQVSTSTTFSALAGTPPKAAIVETAAGFVMLADYNDGSNIFHDGWWCSGLYDHTQWTPSASTQAANGRLLDTHGRITALRQMGNSIVAYKDNSIYLGQYVGPPIIWQWSLVAHDCGAYSQEAVVNISGVHYFMGRNGLFMYDGSRPVPIGAIEVREWLKTNIHQEFVTNVKASFDSKTSLIYWFYPSNSSSSGVCDEAIVYNTITGKFGRFTKSVQAVFDYQTPPMTWLSLGSLYATWTWPTSTTWASPIFYGSLVGASFMGTDKKLYSMTGNASDASITTGDFGDDFSYSTIKRVKPRFLDAPDSAQLVHSYKANEGDNLQTGVTVATFNDGKFDLLKSARFHRVKLNTVGNCELSAIDYELKANGKR